MDRPSPHTRERQRRIDRRRQGDLGEASAIEWLTRQGATIWSPQGHSPDADLIADFDGHLLRVQVKTSTCRVDRSDGCERWDVQLATNGGNQSWSGVSKIFDPSRYEVLFALVADGRRWFIPSEAVEASQGVILGGVKYSEFEIERTSPIDDIVYGGGSSLESESLRGSMQAVQSTRSVKPWAYAFAGSNPASPINAGQPTRADNGDTTRFERSLGRRGQAVVGAKRLITIPKHPFSEAGLNVGDRMRIRADGDGRVLLERIDRSMGVGLPQATSELGATPPPSR
jgi:bifunctional DNA-binding transcriptional regulator/antitoxin component of YhaV-PrlF toxin-antitoxin module